MGIFRKDISEFTGELVEGWKKVMEETKMTEVSREVRN